VLATCDAAIFGLTQLLNNIDDRPLSPYIDRWVNKTHTVQSLNIGWIDKNDINDKFFLQLLKVWNDYDHVPIIIWMPYAWANWSAPNPNDIIANGGYDKYLAYFGKRIKTFLAGPDGVYGNDDDRRVYIRFAPQPNGNWFPWSPYCAWSCEVNGQKIKQSSASYVNMFRHVVDYLDLHMGIRNSTRMQFIWSVNNVDFQEGSLHNFYPGDHYVDWIGVDGVNYGNTVPGNEWSDPEKVYLKVLQNVKNISLSGKPFAVTEFGCVTKPKGVDAKSDWLKTALQLFKEFNVKMIISANGDDKGVFGELNGDDGYEKFKGFKSWKESMSEDWMIGTNSSNKRLVNDHVFMTGIEN